MKLKTTLIAIAIAGLNICNAQSFLNGSFENTTSPNSCNFNVDNATFSSLMQNTTAFGTYEQLDIVIENCFIPTVPDGTYAISISNDANDLTQGEAFSMELSSSLTNGGNYTITFDGFSIPAGGTGPVLIGCSETATDFGAQIYSATTIHDQWESFTFSFDAPNNGMYITIMPEANINSWNCVDNFTIQSNVSLEEQSMNENVFTVFPNPSAEFIQISNLTESTPYSISNSLGQELMSGSVFNEKINVGNLPAGVYFLKLENGRVVSFVKE